MDYSLQVISFSSFRVYLYYLSVKVGEMVYFGVTPQLLKVVKLTGLGHENVHKDVAIVYHYPLSIFISVVIEGLCSNVPARTGALNRQLQLHSSGMCLDKL